MPAVSVCGRFDNAPAHIIIISPRFNPREVGSRVYQAPKPTKKAADLRHIDKERLSKLKAEARKEREAAERLQKMAIMRKKEAKAKRAKAKDWRPEETRDQRRNRKTREKTQARYAVLISALPAGYEPLRGMKLRVKYDAARKVLSKGPVHGIKIGKVWYTSAAVISAYFDQNHARHIEALRKSRKGRKK